VEGRNGSKGTVGFRILRGLGECFVERRDLLTKSVNCGVKSITLDGSKNEKSVNKLVA
jgi:hypothetical protein